ncbi:Kinesin-1 [Apostasia shenzhenica]|uniref:Kinesin-1 n=1 Tax=Apostasia shenzhenica TaxID=1088818 RepID=A0A2I0ADW4_9ASPA|nr:Kinesin-1 [Apostasia shenzhenica]
MMYGPTGSGKSHTMFGCSRKQGIVYRALRDILGEEERDDGVDNAAFRLNLFVQVAVLEIYNEEIYDLLSVGNSNGVGAGVSLPKGATPKAKLEVMGRKAKNATYIYGNEAGKISKEVAKIEKRRVVKSTLCNERSSRSHCMIILDVPPVGGRLLLVDMAGSENIEQAGQTGLEAKMQTAKINQGNVALKRVVESIANGDSHVPFRDSKLTMLLQDSFEDDKSKILMILCASPDPKEMHKTIATLEYGAKAKCIVRVAHMPTPRDKLNTEDSSLLRSRIVAMNQFIYKLQIDNKLKEKERDKAMRDLLHKEEELLGLRLKLELIEARGTAEREEEINCKVMERTQVLIIELQKMEETMHYQQEELSFLRRKLHEIEAKNHKENEDAFQGMDGGKLLKRMSEMCSGDQGMEKSMELDMGDQNSNCDVKEIKEDISHATTDIHLGTHLNSGYSSLEDEIDFDMPKITDRVCLSTVFERDDEGEDEEIMEEPEIDKEVLEELSDSFATLSKDQFKENVKDPTSARKTRIQNIFRLCGNHRELAQQVNLPVSPMKKLENTNIHLSPLALSKDSNAKVNHAVESVVQAKPGKNTIPNVRLTDNMVFSLTPPLASVCFKENEDSKENTTCNGAESANLTEVYVKWEASKESSGNLIRKLMVKKNSSLSDLRNLIEITLLEDNRNQPFAFLLLADPSGTPVVKDKEAEVPVSKLPFCNTQHNSHLACLRHTKSNVQRQNHIPFSPLENMLPLHVMKAQVEEAL